MKIFEDILFWFDEINNKKLFEDTLKLVPRTSEITSKINSSGTYTLFDEAARHSCIFEGERKSDSRKSSVEKIGQSTISQAINLFSENFIKVEKNIAINVPITRVEAVSASKSDLYKYSSLYDFGEHIYNVFKEDLKYLSEREYFKYCIDGGLSEGHIDFDIKLWSPRLRWNNSDGSHRFSTAHYIAVRDKIYFSIKGKLDIFKINYDWLEKLEHYYTPYIIDVQYPIGYSTLLNLFDFKCDYSSSTIIDLKHSYSNSNTNTTVLLLINNNHELSRIAKRWLKQYIQAGKVLHFSEVVNDLKNVEQQAKKDIDIFIKKTDFFKEQKKLNTIFS